MLQHLIGSELDTNKTDERWNLGVAWYSMPSGIYRKVTPTWRDIADHVFRLDRGTFTAPSLSRRPRYTVWIRIWCTSLSYVRCSQAWCDQVIRLRPTSLGHYSWILLLIGPLSRIRESGEGTDQAPKHRDTML